MKTNAHKSILALALAALALAVTPLGFGADTGGYLAPDDRPGLHGPSGIETASTVESRDYLAPDDRPGLHGPGAIDAGAGGIEDTAPPTNVQVAVDGFDWGSAGIGAGAGVGAILAVVGAVLFVRSSRMRTQAT
jgi:hypothetical protein